MDDHFSKACGALSPSDFSHSLDFIYESLASNQTSTQEFTPLIQLTMILLRDHPPSMSLNNFVFCCVELNISIDTLKHIQGFATRCVAVFADRNIYTDGPLPLRIQALEFVARHCSDRVSENI
jgi:hypothetical protein